jgi:hypothetical protein
MTGQAEQTARFLAMHRGPGPLLPPNPWDHGSARAGIGLAAFEADGQPPAAPPGRLSGPGEARSSSLSRRCRAGW